MLMRVCFYIVMSFFMFYLVKYYVIFYSVGVCDYKNKFFVEVGKGFF